MSQLNVDVIKNSGGTGPGLEFLTGGNFAFDTDTLYIDSTNGRVGINTASPNSSIHVEGDDGAYFDCHPMLESANIVANRSNSSTTLYAATASTYLYTSTNNGNWTPDIRGASDGTLLNNMMANGDSLVMTLISTINSSSGYASSLNIDGSGRTVQWADDETPAERGGNSGFDVYSYTIVKQGNNNFAVLGSKTWFN